MSFPKLLAMQIALKVERAKPSSTTLIEKTFVRSSFCGISYRMLRRLPDKPS